jgi:hypothetical protein
MSTLSDGLGLCYRGGTLPDGLGFCLRKKAAAETSPAGRFDRLPAGRSLTVNGNRGQYQHHDDKNNRF